MRTQEELRAGCAEMLKRLRLDAGLSKSKMADLVYIDDHTWARYETGESAPNVPDFVYIFDALGKSALRTVLNYIYPDIYTPLGADADITQLRAAAIHYFDVVASEHAVRELTYLVFGDHGSNFVAQLEMLTMIDHLPMPYRVAISRLVDTFWSLADAKGELINTDLAIPDVELFRAAISKGTTAAQSGQDGYTTACK